MCILQREFCPGKDDGRDGIKRKVFLELFPGVFCPRYALHEVYTLHHKYCLHDAVIYYDLALGKGFASHGVTNYHCLSSRWIEIKSMQLTQIYKYYMNRTSPGHSNERAKRTIVSFILASEVFVFSWRAFLRYSSLCIVIPVVLVPLNVSWLHHKLWTRLQLK